MFKIDEHIYESNLPIQYVFEKGNKNYLIVAFSAFSPRNAVNQKAYNHMRTLEDIDCNKLFILDGYGPKGCYYIGEQLNFEVETSVQSLITYIARKCSVPLSHIICTGSSKGGSAALYYGLKYNYGHIICGAPQTRIGDFVTKTRVEKETAQYMVGDDPTGENNEYLNNIIFRQLNKPILTNLHMYTSEKDEQFDEHIRPLLDIIKDKNIPNDIQLDNSMLSHADIANHFPIYLKDMVQKIIYDIKSIKTNCTADSDKINISVDLEMQDFAKYKSVEYNYFFKAGEIEHTYTTTKNSYTFKPKSIGCYVCIVSVLIDGEKTYTINLGEKIISKNIFNLKGYDFTQNGTDLSFAINIDTREKLHYAFYVYKNNEAVMKGAYTTSNTLTFPLQGAGKYFVTFFVKTKNGDKIVCRSNILKID